jgi:hypothetical protein
MTTTKSRTALLTLYDQQTRLIRQLLTLQPLLRGTVSHVVTRCGKARCWCAQSPKGHPHVRMSWSQQGTIITRKVPSSDLTNVRTLTENYRRFRSLRRRLLGMQSKMKNMFDDYEMALIEQSRMRLPFLSVATNNAAQKNKGVQ